MPRLDQLLKMLAGEPQDTFLRYALAMEYRSLGEPVPAAENFLKLIGQHPPHVPSFFMYSQLLVETGEIEQARAILRDGIEQARAQGDAHAAGEMSQFLADLGQLGE
jgi:thioredoxin-like negative regulator of GroEL